MELGMKTLITFNSKGIVHLKDLSSVMHPHVIENL